MKKQDIVKKVINNLIIKDKSSEIKRLEKKLEKIILSLIKR